MLSAPVVRLWCTASQELRKLCLEVRKQLHPRGDEPAAGLNLDPSGLIGELERCVLDWAEQHGYRERRRVEVCTRERRTWEREARSEPPRQPPPRLLSLPACSPSSQVRPLSCGLFVRRAERSI